MSYTGGSDRLDWTDRRIDDLSTLVHTNDHRLDENDRMVDELRDRCSRIEHEISSIMKTGDRRSDRHWSLIIALLPVTISSIVTLIVLIAHLH